MSEKKQTATPDLEPQLPVPAEPANGDLLPATMQKSRMYSSLDKSDPAQAAALFQALNGQGEQFKACVGQELSVTHVIVRERCRFRQEDGEEIVTTVGTVVTDAGRVVSGTSIGVLESLQNLLFVRPRLPYVPPVKVRVAQRGRVLVLEMIDLGLSGKRK